MADVLLEEAEPGIVVLTLNRPERLNALGLGLIEQMHDAVDELAVSKRVRAVVLTGAGRAFSAGADLKAGDDPAQPQSRGDVPGLFAMQERMTSLHEKIHRLRPPVVAAVNGVAVGGGFSLALASDIRFAARSARFGAVFITIGISSCDMGTSYFLPRLVGASRSAELMLTGRIFEADEALDMGLVLEVVDDGAVVDRALATCRQIARNAPLAVWMTKETMWQNIDAPSLRHALDLENRTQVMCSQTGEAEEAALAFMQKRAPRWNDL
ncbi:MAG: putative enoyl-CoA hydratase [Pseudonocardiales bacterium]|nr:putative enoyl-CoA hydratase [Pseudonocardiales bacterium]